MFDKPTQEKHAQHHPAHKPAALLQRKTAPQLGPDHGAQPGRQAQQPQYIPGQKQAGKGRQIAAQVGYLGCPAGGDILQAKNVNKK